MMKHAWIGLLALLFCTSTQAQNLGAEVAGLREDVRIMAQRIGAMALRIEQLERENARLLQATDGIDRTYATAADLNDAVAEINAAINSGDVTTRSQLQEAIKKLAKETDSAINSLAKNITTRTAISTPQFSDDFPDEGVVYTVQKGDTLSSIAKRFNSTIKDIQNANRITDPRKVQVGQTLFIPGGQ